MNILIWGAGNNGKVYLEYVNECEKDNSVVGFLDNNPKLQGKKISSDVGAFYGKKGEAWSWDIFPPEKISDIIFDKVVVTNQSMEQIKEIKKQLRELVVAEDKIIVLMENIELKRNVFSSVNRYDEMTDIRVRWLKNFSVFACENNMSGNVAECGVYRGEFAYFINKYFKEKILYLFDAFEGFNKNDVAAELELNNYAFNSGNFAKDNIFKVTDEDIVMRRMPFPNKCIIKKGYFPYSANGLEDTFCFVNLDMDLYKPMLSALEYFYGRMTGGGVILLHDYFHPELPGVKRAVEEFEKKLNRAVCKVPIGDRCSLAIINDEIKKI